MQKKRAFFLSILIISIFLQSCASSNITREVTDNIDVGYHNTGVTFGSLGNGSIADTYGNTSQQTKGMIFGGVAGGVVGSLSTGIGAIAGVTTGAILGGAYGAYVDSHTSLLDRLENRGVKVIVLGDQILIVLKSNRLFNARTPVIIPGAYSTLDLIVRFINQYPNMMVKVNGHTNDVGPRAVDVAISKEQAESIARYMWRRGLNTRLLTSEGFGGSRLVTRNSLDWDKTDNYRIEITLEKLPV